MAKNVMVERCSLLIFCRFGIIVSYSFQPSKMGTGNILRINRTQFTIIPSVKKAMTGEFGLFSMADNIEYISENPNAKIRLEIGPAQETMRWLCLRRILFGCTGTAPHAKPKTISNIIDVVPISTNGFRV